VSRLTVRRMQLQSTSGKKSRQWTDDVKISVDVSLSLNIKRQHMLRTSSFVTLYSSIDAHHRSLDTVTFSLPPKEFSCLESGHAIAERFPVACGGRKTAALFSSTNK
jgi:hypothetical protein